MLLSFPHHSCISKRVKMIDVAFKIKFKKTIYHLVINSTGLKFTVKENGKSKSMVLAKNSESGISCI
ncbi:Mobile element protein [Candidatus Enterovibrio altilux]|uniref:Mobile element protein n=1 Tax=Candidatus Enterovibrio altilux TaxID=1927128 RepID=A0A291BAL1_9GAMM|nr:Mobile element protein [Candidatus Enterovibrio luxaltus]